MTYSFLPAEIGPIKHQLGSFPVWTKQNQAVFSKSWYCGKNTFSTDWPHGLAKVACTSTGQYAQSVCSL